MESEHLEWENDDTVYNVMEMLNVSLVSNDKPSRPNNNKPAENNQNQEHGSNQELKYQCLILGTDLLLSRQENAHLAQNVSTLTGENEKLKSENADLVDKLSKLTTFSKELQKEFKVFINLFVNKLGKESGNLELGSKKFGELLKKLALISGKIPLQRLADWNTVKLNFQQVNRILKPKTTAASGVVTQDVSGCGNISYTNDNYYDLPKNANKHIEMLGENTAALQQQQQQQYPVVATQNPIPIIPSFLSACPSVCALCRLKCTCISSMLLHTALAHHGCLPCRKTFESEDMLANHIQYAHLYRQPTQGGNGSELQLIPYNDSHPNHGIIFPSQSKVWHKCLCGYTFKTKLELLIHIFYKNLERT